MSVENKSEVVSTESLIVRDGKEEDKPFIFSSWLPSLYYGDSWFSHIPKDIFMKNYHDILEQILTRAIIKVACLKSDPDIIVGYAIFSFAQPASRCLEWTYVKAAWRGIGVAKMLVPASEINTVTHLNRVGVSILYNHPNIVFNPFISRS